jgi:hypothetical protein
VSRGGGETGRRAGAERVGGSALGRFGVGAWGRNVSAGRRWGVVLSIADTPTRPYADTFLPAPIRFCLILETALEHFGHLIP